MKCADCDSVLEEGQANLITLGWRYIRLVEDEDDHEGSGNGWRCPSCTAKWDALFEAIGETLQ
jgi:hypothetical protein